MVAAMNIREIEIFRTVMFEGSFSGAAQRLRIAQPAVSKYVAQLERRLGLALFRRSGNRIAPTPEGKALFEQVDRLFVGLDQVERFMVDLSQSRRGHVTVACMPLLSLTAMPDVVAAFTQERPDISISLQTRSSARIAEWVSARQIDFGVGIYSARNPGVRVEPLVELELFAALPAGDPLEGRAIIEPADLEGRNIIALSNHDGSQVALDALLDRRRVTPRRRIDVFWTSVAIELTMRGAGIAFVDRLTALRSPGAIARLRPFRPRISVEVSMMWPDHWEASGVAREFAERVRLHVVAEAARSAVPSLIA